LKCSIWLLFQAQKHLFQYCPERQKKKDEVSDEDSAGDVQEFLEVDPEKNNNEAGWGAKRNRLQRKSSNLNTIFLVNQSSVNLNF